MSIVIFGSANAYTTGCDDIYIHLSIIIDMDGNAPPGEKTGTYKRYPSNTPNNHAAIMATRRYYGLTTDFMEAFFIILMGIFYETVRDGVLGKSGEVEAGWSVEGSRNRNLRDQDQRRQIHATMYNIVAHAASDPGITRLPLDIILGLREPTNGENLQLNLLHSVFGTDTTMEKRLIQFATLANMPEYSKVSGKAAGLGVDFSYLGSRTQMAALELVEKPVKKGKPAVERASDLENGTKDKDYDFIHAHVSIPRTYFRTDGSGGLSGWHFSNHHQSTTSANGYHAFFSNAGERFGKSRKAVKMAARERAAGAAAAGAGGGGAEEVENNYTNNTRSENINNNESEHLAHLELAASAVPTRKVIHQFEIQNSFYTPYIIKLYDDGGMTYTRVDNPAEGGAGAAGVSKKTKKYKELNVLTNAEISQKVKAIKGKLTNLLATNGNIAPFIEKLNAANESIGKSHVQATIEKIKILFRELIDLKYNYLKVGLALKKFGEDDGEIMATIAAGSLIFRDQYGREPSPVEFMQLFQHIHEKSRKLHQKIQIFKAKAVDLYSQIQKNKLEYEKKLHELKQLGQILNRNAGDNDPEVLEKIAQVRAMKQELSGKLTSENQGPAGGRSQGGRRRTLKVRRR